MIKLAETHYKVQECEKCSIKMFPKVHFGGKPTAKIMIIGEAPGEQEVRLQRPFVGPEGQILSSWLQEIGFAKDVYVTNVLKCRPPNNDIHVPEATTWIRNCTKYLRVEIKQIRPKLILVIGATAAGFFGYTNILKLSGTVVDSLDFNCKLLFCIHPSYVIRQPESLERFVNCLITFKSLADGSI